MFLIAENAPKANANLVILSSPMDQLNLIVPENVDSVTFVPSTQLLKSVVLSVSRELLHVPKLVTKEKPSVLTASVD